MSVHLGRPARRPGLVSLVGAGPGDRELAAGRAPAVADPVALAAVR